MFSGVHKPNKAGSLASQPYFSTYVHTRAKVGGEGRKNKSGQTCQVFVARAQDPEPANQIAAMCKLHVN